MKNIKKLLTIIMASTIAMSNITVTPVFADVEPVNELEVIEDSAPDLVSLDNDTEVSDDVTEPVDLEETDKIFDDAENASDLDTDNEVSTLEEDNTDEKPSELSYKELNTSSNSREFTASGDMPEDAELVVDALSVEDVEDVINDENFTVHEVYDIKIMVDGVEWQPENGNISISVANVELEKDDLDVITDTVVLHIDDDNNVEELSCNVTDNGNDQTIEFETSGFSMFIIGEYVYETTHAIKTWEVGADNPADVKAYLFASYYETNADGTVGSIHVYYDEYCLAFIGSGDIKDFASVGTQSSPNPDTAPWYWDYHDQIIAVEFDDRITSLGDYSLYGLSRVSSLDLPDSLTRIGRYAIHYMFQEDLATHERTGLTELTIPDGVTTIGDNAFTCNRALETVHMPNTVTSMGEQVFNSCMALKTVNIPTSLSTIPFATFIDCQSLEEITIPTNITSIGEKAFMTCPNLEKIHLDNVTLTDDFTFVGDMPSDIVTYYRPDATPITKLTAGVTYNETIYKNLSSIPDGSVETWEVGYPNVHNIVAKLYYFNDTDDTDGYKLVFEGSGRMQNFTRSPDTMPWDAYMDQIVDVTFENEITYIGNNAFNEAENLETVSFPTDLEQVGSSAFRACKKLNFTSLPDNVSSLYDYAFSGCQSLTLAELPADIVQIGNGTFAGCYELALTEIPAGIDTIGATTFSACHAMDIDTISGINSIGESGFFGCRFDAITIDGCNNIGYTAFGGCSYLNTVALKNISNGTFDNTAFDTLNSQVQTFILDNVKLSTDYTLPSTFYKADGTPITKLAAGTTYNETIYKTPPATNVYKKFYCGYPTETDVVGTIYYINGRDDTDGLRIEFVGTGKIKDFSVDYPTNNIVRPWDTSDDIKIIDASLSYGITRTGAFMLDGCENLTSVTLPESLIVIDKQTFYRCKSLSSVVLHDHLYNIGAGAFQDCTGLTTIVIPGSVTTIGQQAFDGCSNLISVVMNSDGFGGVQTIGTSAFRGCTNLSEIVFSNRLNTIGYEAFSNDKNLVEVNFPDSITKIQGTAFKDCTGLTSIEIPSSVTSIGASAFVGCSNLDCITLNGVSLNSNFGLPYTYYHADGTEITTLEAGTTYSETITRTRPTKHVTFKDYDGTEIKSVDVAIGAVPSITDPTRTGDDLHTYTFTGWRSSIDSKLYKTADLPAMGERDTTYTAEYRCNTTGGITINFSTEQPNAIRSTTSAYVGDILEIPAYEDYTDFRNRHIFTGLYERVECCFQSIYVDPTTYVSGNTYMQSPHYCTVGTYKTINYIEKGREYSVPDYTVSIPNIRGGFSDTYPSFLSDIYQKESPNAEGKIAIYCYDTDHVMYWYTPVYSAVPTQYTYCFMTAQNNNYYSKTVDFGTEKPVPATTPREYTTEHEKLTFKEWNYTETENEAFARWVNEGKPTENPVIIVEAVYDSTPIYHVDFLTGPSHLEKGVYEAGETIVVPDSSTVTHSPSNIYSNDFIGWRSSVNDRVVQPDDITTACEDVVYTPVWREWETFKYTFMRDTEGDAVFRELNQRENQAPHVPDGGPTKRGTDTYDYIFKGWTPDIPDVVTGNMTFRPIWDTEEVAIIKFTNWNGETISNTRYKKGETVVAPAIPTREPVDDVTFEFVGWKNMTDTTDTSMTVKTIADVSTTYKATFNEIRPTYYRITFKNGSEIVNEQMYKENVNVVEPILENYEDEDYYYFFKGWSPVVTKAVKNQIYTAQWDKTAKEKAKYYKITFKNGSRTVHEQTYLENSTVTAPVLDNYETDDYIYTFKGWSPAVTKAVKNQIYTAVWESTPKEKAKYYKITFKNGSKIISEQTYLENSKITVPTLEDYQNGNTTYKFKGWQPDVSKTAVKDATYTAKWEISEKPETKYYKITFKDGSRIVNEQTYKSGDTVNTPSMSNYEDANTYYKFDGWQPDVTRAYKDQTYTAKWIKTGKTTPTPTPVVTTTPVTPTPVTPTPTPVITRTPVTPTPTPTVTKAPATPAKMYSVRFMDGEEVVDEKTYREGETPIAPVLKIKVTGDTVVKGNDDKVSVKTDNTADKNKDAKKDNSAYEFKAWRSSVDKKEYLPNELPAVTESVTYTAVWEEIEKPVTAYKLSFFDDDGTKLTEIMVKPGEEPENLPVIEKKTTKAGEYTFKGWRPEIPKVIDKDMTFVAVYDLKKAEPTPTPTPAPVKKVPSEVTVKFVDKDGNMIKKITVKSGTVLKDTDMPLPPDSRGLKFQKWDYDGKPIVKDTEIKAEYKTDLVTKFGVPVIAGAATAATVGGLGILGATKGWWTLLINLLLLKRRKKLHGAWIYDDNKFVKLIPAKGKTLDDIKSIDDLVGKARLTGMDHKAFIDDLENNADCICVLPYDAFINFSAQMPNGEVISQDVTKMSEKQIFDMLRSYEGGKPAIHIDSTAADLAETVTIDL